MTASKLQYLLEHSPAEPLAAFRRRVVDELGPRLLAHGPARLKLTFCSVEPPRLSVLPLRRERVVLISIWDEGPPREAAERWNERVGESGGGTLAGYRVEEGLPCAYERRWPDGESTPGAGLLTLLRRKRGLSDEEFFRRWFDGHSVLSLEIHPLWNYVRNVVQGPVVAGSPPLDGIVEEHFRRSADLLDPVVFFGGPLRLLPNMVRVGLDILGFLDLWTLRSYLVEERWLRG